MRLAASFGLRIPGALANGDFGGTDVHFGVEFGGAVQIVVGEAADAGAGLPTQPLYRHDAGVSANDPGRCTCSKSTGPRGRNLPKNQHTEIQVHFWCYSGGGG